MAFSMVFLCRSGVSAKKRFSRDTPFPWNNALLPHGIKPLPWKNDPLLSRNTSFPHRKGSIFNDLNKIYYLYMEEESLLIFFIHI
jgi:hypothetical protein